MTSQKSFKPGDLVVCVDDTETLGKLEHGKTYKVIKSDAYFTFLEGLRDSNNGYYSGRFELVEEIPKTQLFKVGDKIRCIAGYYELTKGITYTVEDLGTGLTGNKTVKLVGVDNYWNEGRFELVQPELVQEPSSKTQFKVGDICSAFGCEGTVKQIATGCTYPVQVALNGEHYHWFTLDGKLSDWHKTPSLFLVSRPKKKVTKTVEAWANVYSMGRPTLHLSEEQAKYFSRGLKVIACVKLTGEYEVEVEE